MLKNKKAISTLTLLILIAISAIIGGIISYMLTIAYYVEIEYNIPRNETILVITNVSFNPKNADSFTIEVLNPSYSIADATITGIAVSVEGEDVLYNITDTSPFLKGKAVTVPIGETLKITCYRVKVANKDINWGLFATENSGKKITVYVFSKEASITSREFQLPYVKLEVIPNFFHEVTFNSFNLTLKNSGQENLTITSIDMWDITLGKKNTGVDISEGIPLPVNHSITLTCTENWNGKRGKITINTREGYVFTIEKLDVPYVSLFVKDVSFNENDTSNFNVTLDVTAYRVKSGYVNITSVTLTLENGTELSLDLPKAVGIEYNSTETFSVSWNWKEYRGHELNVTVQTLQGLAAVKREIVTPDPIIIRALNKEKTFNLTDKQHFNVTLQNHPSSLDAVNITKILIKETGEIINGTKVIPQLPWGLLRPGEIQSFYCNATIDWNKYAGKNLTLVIYVTANSTGEEYEFEFVFTLPKAELNITSVKPTEIGLTKYLNITVENLPYSVWNLTISKIVITFENQTESVEMQLTPSQVTLAPGEEMAILFPLRWEELVGENITVEVLTEEGIKASWSGVISS